jgi:hypothetical protein
MDITGWGQIFEDTTDVVLIVTMQDARSSSVATSG